MEKQCLSITGYLSKFGTTFLSRVSGTYSSTRVTSLVQTAYLGQGPFCANDQFCLFPVQVRPIISTIIRPRNLLWCQIPCLCCFLTQKILLILIFQAIRPSMIPLLRESTITPATSLHAREA